jgi:hypothetical protein
MKSLQPIAFVSLMLASLSALAEQPIINLSVGGEIAPGVYGQVRFGNAPPPPVVLAEPVIIERHAPNVEVQPIYLHVPPDHQRNWASHCHEYRACNRPVYFVKSREYEPGYRKEERRDERHDMRRDERREERRDERREERRDER